MINQSYRLFSPRQIRCELIDEKVSTEDVVVRPTYLSICAADQRYYTGNRSKEVLKKLKEQDKKIAIVSSRWGQRIHDILVNLEARDLVDIIIGTEHVDKYKPDPEGMFKVIDMMKCKVPLYVGDSYIDAETAQNANVDFVGVTTGTTSRQKLESYPNVAVLDDIATILEIVK